MIFDEPTAIRQTLIEFGLLKPGSVGDLRLTVLDLPPDANVLRLDAEGRRVAAARIASPGPLYQPEFSFRHWLETPRRRVA